MDTRQHRSFSVTITVIFENIYQENVIVLKQLLDMVNAFCKSNMPRLYTRNNESFSVHG